MNKNIDGKVVEDFGKEWSSFDQSAVPAAELEAQFRRYFALFPFDQLPENAQGFDLGCGSGRWARLVAPRVGSLYCVDPSPAALAVARKNLAGSGNCRFFLSGIDDMPLEDNSMDFGYSLGVLHHVPNTQAGIQTCVSKLRPGAPFLLYLYYAFDNRPAWFKVLWKVSDMLRRILSRSPYPLKYLASQLIALLVYLPLARLARLLERAGMKVDHIPLSAYRDKSLYTLRTDALDRFGTRLEQRFSKKQIKVMMLRAGLENIRFSDQEPYWCAVGYKALL